MDQLDQFAPFYDLEYGDFDDDLLMYGQLAEWCAPEGKKARVLEMACGSGRVLLALAENGHECVGVDASAAMLEIARRRAAERGLRVSLQQGQMQDAGVVAEWGRFNLAICALNSFSYLTTRDEQLAALRAMHDALAHGGLALIDVTPPGNAEPFPAQGEVVLQGRWPYQGGSVTKMVSGSWDAAAQQHSVTWIYDYSDAAGLLRRTVIEQELRYIYPAEAELLVEVAGMRFEEAYGGYDLEPFDSSSERMIVLARRVD